MLDVLCNNLKLIVIKMFLFCLGLKLLNDFDLEMMIFNIKNYI